MDLRTRLEINVYQPWSLGLHTPRKLAKTASSL